MTTMVPAGIPRRELMMTVLSFRGVLSGDSQEHHLHSYWSCLKVQSHETSGLMLNSVNNVCQPRFLW